MRSLRTADVLAGAPAKRHLRTTPPAIEVAAPSSVLAMDFMHMTIMNELAAAAREAPRNLDNVQVAMKQAKPSTPPPSPQETKAAALQQTNAPVPTFFIDRDARVGPYVQMFLCHGRYLIFILQSDTDCKGSLPAETPADILNELVYFGIYPDLLAPEPLTSKSGRTRCVCKTLAVMSRSFTSMI